MTYKDMQIAFELESTSNYVNLDNKPLSKEIEYWLNEGLDKFVKTRYSGINFKRESFEQSQKRIDDLRILVTSVTLYALQFITENDEVYYIELPTDYLFLVNDKVGLLPLSDKAKDCWKIDDDGNYKEIYTDPIQATADNIDFKLSNSLSDHRYHNNKAKPLRRMRGNILFYYTDSNYLVNDVVVEYIKKPNKIDIHSNPSQEYTNMPEHTHKEIIKLGVQAYLENKINPRYESFNNEVSTME